MRLAVAAFAILSVIIAPQAVAQSLSQIVPPPTADETPDYEARCKLAADLIPVVYRGKLEGKSLVEIGKSIDPALIQRIDDPTFLDVWVAGAYDLPPEIDIVRYQKDALQVCFDFQPILERTRRD